MQDWLYVLVFFGLISGASVTLPLFGMPTIAPNLAVIGLVFAATHRSPFHAWIVTLVIGATGAVVAGGAHGSWMVGMMAVTSATLLMRARLVVSSSLSLSVWCAFCALLVDGIVWLVTRVTRPDLSLGGLLVGDGMVHALATGLTALPLVAVLLRLEPLMEARQQRALFVR